MSQKICYSPNFIDIAIRFVIQCIINLIIFEVEISTKTTNVDPRQEKIWSEREIAALSMAEFDKYEKEISDAMQEGRITK